LYVLHVVESFGAGTMQVVRQIARSLADRGERTAIAYGVVPETPPVAGDGLESVELIPLPWSDRGWRTQFAVARRLRRILDRERPDVVHLHSSFAGFVGALAGGAQRSIYTPHGYSFQQTDLARARRLALQAIEILIARRVGRVIGVSEHERELARRRARARDPGVVLNGIAELDHPVAPVQKPSPPRVVAAGRLTAARRPEEAARILAAARDHADVAWLGGGGRDEAARVTLDALGIPVTGWLERGAALEALRAATVYLHWSAWDGLSLAILEAFAADVAVVASAIPQNRAVLPEGQTAADAEAAIALVRRLVTDPGLLERTRAAQRAVAVRYSGARMCDEWRARYEELVAT
jgi:glycosyltransferase involved in cell wall biosynthesis